nr:MAG TPA: hypothetical protein [Caudoviricetes sp.]
MFCIMKILVLCKFEFNFDTMSRQLRILLD